MDETFSQRMGFVPPKVGLQLDSMDDALRNLLWSAVHEHYWSHFEDDESDTLEAMSGAAQNFFYYLWRDLYQWPVDTLPFRWREAVAIFRSEFFARPWYHPYDFIEFVVHSYPDYYDDNRAFIDRCNYFLQRENSTYRFVDSMLVRVTSAEEISAIETALVTTARAQPLKPTHNHLKQAVVLLADRQSPDLRNSMKESISAVEALCKWLTNDPKGTLGSALAAIERSKVVQLHPSLREAFAKLYGYTSDAGGIRHALKDEPNLDIEDAVFMLASCSAFVSYLTAKASKAGLLPAISDE